MMKKINLFLVTFFLLSSKIQASESQGLLSALNLDDDYHLNRGLIKTYKNILDEKNINNQIIPSYDLAQVNNSPKLKRKDVDRAKVLYLQGLFLLEVTDGDADDSDAETYLNESIQLGYAPAAYRLGLFYEAQKKYSKAYLYYKIGTDLGCGESLINLGNLYHQGLGCTSSDEKAVTCYERAKKYCYPEAVYNLGIMHFEGKGVEKNYSQAKKYFELAESHGLAEAKYNLGVMYYNGFGTEQDVLSAITLFEQAAELGDEDAVHNLNFIAQQPEFEIYFNEN